MVETAPLETQALAIMEKYGVVDPREEVKDLPDPEYSDVVAAMSELRRTVAVVIAADQAQSEHVLGVLRSHFPSVWTSVTEQLQGLVQGLVADVEERLGGLQELVDARLAPHAELPGKLELERDQERDRADRITQVAVQTSELLEHEGWTGGAAEGYRRAALVQTKALEELAGVQHSSSNALETSAVLNRAAFFYVGEAISFASSQIRVLPAGDSTSLFQRTRNIDGHLRALYGKIDHELNSISTGEPATNLARQLEQLLATPAIISGVGWPTGGDAADVTPAATRGVVPPLT